MIVSKLNTDNDYSKKTRESENVCLLINEQNRKQSNNEKKVNHTYK